MSKVFFLLLCAVPGFAARQPGDEAAQSIGSALRSGENARAKALAAEAVRKWPGDVRLQTMQGLAFRNLGDESEALSAFDRALVISPGYLPALQGSAEIEYKRGNDRAVLLLDRILKLQPALETAHAMRAVLAANRGDCPTAIRHFGSSGQALESQPAALSQYGGCLVKLERFETAIPVLERLLALDASIPLSRYKLASVYWFAKRNEDALRTLKPLLDAKDAPALSLASSIYEAIGDTPTAVSLLRDAIVRAPEQPQAYLAFASLSFIHNSYQAGIDMIDAGLLRLPNNPQLHLARGVLYVQLGQLEKADADFAIAESFDPEQSTSSVARVLTKFQASEPRLARTMIDEELKSHPGDAFLYYLKAEILRSQGARPGSPEFQQALDAGRRAIELQPNLVLARNVLSRLYLEAGDVARAIDQCRQALREQPFDQVALYRLIRALKMTGKPEDAAQIQNLLKRFSEAREKSVQQEAGENRYRLFVSPGPEPKQVQPKQTP